MINVSDVLEDAAKEQIKKLFSVYVSNKIDKDPNAKAYFKNGLKYCLEALKELNNENS